MALHRRTPANIIELAKILINAEVLPHLAPHGAKKSAWDQISKSYSDNIGVKVCENTMKNLVEDMQALAEQVGDGLTTQQLVTALKVVDLPKNSSSIVAELHGHLLHLRHLLREGKQVIVLLF